MASSIEENVTDSSDEEVATKKLDTIDTKKHVTFDSRTFQYYEAIYEPSPIPQPIDDPVFTISIGSNNQIWGLTQLGRLFQLLHQETNTGLWKPFESTISFESISVTKKGVLFGVDKDCGRIYKMGSHRTMEPLSQDINCYSFKSISNRSSRKIFAITSDYLPVYVHIHVLRRGKCQWRRLGSEKIKKISVGGRGAIGKSELWGLDMNDEAVKWSEQSNTWIKADEKLLDLSVSSDNVVYGIRKYDGMLVKYDLLKRMFIHEINSEQNRPLTNVAAYKQGRCVFSVDQITGNLVKMIV
ncbi:hypothetical protein AKO1_011244 [Acrasis kona]|uniref:Uncharacterized protein n=1 Tax=Acrasis kona TaxID=1008807 RepID=A0AAW2YWV1_9EUKA